MFQLVCDPSGVVVDTTIKELVPALLKWGNKLDHHFSSITFLHIELCSGMMFLSNGSFQEISSRQYPITLSLTLYFFSAAHLFQGWKVLLSPIFMF